MPGIPWNSGHLGSKWTPGFVKSCQLELANCSPTFAGNSVEFRANRDLQAKSCQLRFENSSLWVAGFWFYSLDLPDFPWNSWQIGGGKSPTLVGGILKIWWKWVEKMKKSRHQMPDSELALPNPDDQRLSKSTFQEKCWCKACKSEVTGIQWFFSSWPPSLWGHWHLSGSGSLC